MNSNLDDRIAQLVRFAYTPLGLFFDPGKTDELIARFGQDAFDFCVAAGTITPRQPPKPKEP